MRADAPAVRPGRPDLGAGHAARVGPLGRLARFHRASYRLDHIAQNTWRFGLDRILTGVAMSDDAHAWLDTALPLDDVGSDRVDVAGRFAELVDRLTSVIDRLSGVRPLTRWTVVPGASARVCSNCSNGAGGAANEGARAAGACRPATARHAQDRRTLRRAAAARRHRACAGGKTAPAAAG